MRILVVNDLHLEFGNPASGLGGADVVVMAGDIHVGTRGLGWARSVAPDVPIVCVPGNHEYYGRAAPRGVEKLRQAAVSTRIHVLDRDAVTLDGVTFLGATLWTDFDLFEDRPAGMAAAAEAVTDYRRIRTSPSFRRMRPADTAAMHGGSRRWIEQEVESGGTHGAVVVTDHAPSMRSIRPTLREDPVSASYASILDDLVEASSAAVWIHGHTHYCVDYTLGGTRVVSNQRGYVDEPVEGFDPTLTVEV